MTQDIRKEAMAAELREMASLGWKHEEAYDKAEEFLERLGEAGEGFGEAEVFQTWETVWNGIFDEMKASGISIQKRFWLDMVEGEAILLRKAENEDEADTIVWVGKLEDAGIEGDNDPYYDSKLDAFFEKELHIKPEEWEVG